MECNNKLIEICSTINIYKHWYKKDQINQDMLLSGNNHLPFTLCNSLHLWLFFRTACLDFIPYFTVVLVLLCVVQQQASRCQLYIINRTHSYFDHMGMNMLEHCFSPLFCPCCRSNLAWSVCTGTSARQWTWHVPILAQATVKGAEECRETDATSWPLSAARRSGSAVFHYTTGKRL